MSSVSDNSPNLWQKIRYHAFSIYEKTKDIDAALSVLCKYEMPANTSRKFYVGLKAELIFYKGEGRRLSLDPSLDAGVKADFSGLQQGRPISIDVTTNTDYKNIDDYAGPTRKRGRLYLIADVDIKTEKYELFPLRFPLCPDCDKFSHYILFMDTPEMGSHYWASQSQAVVRHCPECWSFQELTNYAYIVDSPLHQLREIEGEQMEDETADPSFKRQPFLDKESTPIVQFFEKIDRRLLSGLAEMDYTTYGPDGEGDWNGILLWHHPLVRNLNDELDYSI